MTDSVFGNLFSTKGRKRRLNYGLLMLALAGVYTVVAFVAVFAFRNPDFDPEDPQPGVLPFNGAAIGIFVLLYLIATPITIIAGIKRLKDTDNNPWMILLTFVPVLGMIMALYMLFAEGTIGPNKYGPDPKRPELGSPGAGETFDWQKAVNS